MEPSTNQSLNYKEGSLQQDIGRLKILHELDRAITASLRLTDIYHTFAGHATRLLFFDFIFITLLEGNDLHVAFIAGEDKDKTSLSVGAALPRQTSSLGWVIKQGQPLLRHNIAINTPFAPTEPLFAEGVRSSMIVPLRVKRRVIGALSINSRQVGAYSPDDLEIAEAMTGQLAIAIENARLYEQAQQEISIRQRVEKALESSHQQLKVAYRQATIYAQELSQEIGERKRANEALRKIHAELEKRVEERTIELSKANAELRQQIVERKRVEEALRESEQQLMHAALHDGLTSLPNRTLFMNQLDQAIERAQQDEDNLFAVLFLDLDRFKLINDSLGHLVGDQLLKTMADRLKVCLRPPHLVARWGGDEFTILLNDLADKREVEQVAELIQQKVAKPVYLSGREVFLTASIGITLGSREYKRSEDLLRDADTAMYVAKGGRGQIARN